MSRYAAIPLTVNLSPGHSDITRFRDRKLFGSRRKNVKIVQATGTIEVFDPRSGISGPTSLRASACSNIHE